MVAGLPGTGVGGIFYLILAAAMPFVELYRTLRGKGSIRRWGFIALQLTLVVWIFLAVWAEVWCLNSAAAWCHQVAASKGWVSPAVTSTSLFSTKAMSYATAVGGLFTLGTVFVAVQLLRLRYARKDASEVVRGLR
jgi:hypothetical protein